MKFLIDMGISPDVCAFLRSLGDEAVHLQEEGLGTLLDSAILEKARDEGRVVLAHDLEFGDLLAASGDDLPSVVIFRLRNMRPERVSNALDRVLAQCRDALEKGAVVSVDEVSIRTRPPSIMAAE